MKTFELFPTLVAADLYDDKDSFKKIFFDNIDQYVREDGVTGEASGNVDLHLNPQFVNLFRFVSNTAEQYIEALVGTKEIWEPWIVKSWFSDFSVPAHDHADAHLSFVYYVNVPPDKASPLHMIPPIDRLNDLTSGMFLPNKNIEVVKYNNQYNCTSVVFQPSEGTLLLFPSKMKHTVEPFQRSDNIQDNRISIAGDFILTFKETTARSMGLQPISNWRSMNI
jgi:hypothetical protein